MKALLRTIWPALLWPVFIWSLLLLPGKHLPNESLFPLPHADKLVHAFLFFVLAYIWLKAAHVRNRLNKSVVLGILFSAIAYGLLLEVLQQYTGRDFDGWDGLANSIGVLLAAGLFCKKM